MDIQSIKLAVCKTGLILQKHAPEILTAVGVAGSVASTVLACRATLKVEHILDEANETKEKIESVYEDGNPEYPEEDYQKDKMLLKVQTGAKLVRNYAPAVTVGALSIACLIGSNRILNGRNVAILGAYKLAQESFDKYRCKVREELGEDQDNHFYYGTVTEESKEKVQGKDGKTKTVKSEIQRLPNGVIASQYARFFDECNSNWSKSPDQNKYFLQRVQAMFNDKLKARGYVFLNEVYDILGFKPTKAGQCVGWVLPKNGGDGDGYIDFHIFDPDNFAKREFVNGYERSILLDFNVDGVILDLIDQMA